MEPRTEAEILAQAPLKVFFGDKQYDIKPLTILKSRAWREKLQESLGTIIQGFEAPLDTANPRNLATSLNGGLIAALVQFPEKIADLVFLYAPDLPKKEILKNATEEQIVSAFSAITQVAFPFLPHLGMMRTLMSSR